MQSDPLLSPVSRRLLALFLTITTIFAGTFLLFFLRAGQTRTISSVIRRYEFTELTPPSTLAPPGTIVDVIKENPLVIGVICRASDALGPDLQSLVLESASTASKQVAEFTGEFRLGIDAQKQITSDLDPKFIRNIIVTLSNVKIVELPDSVVFDLIGGRTDGCAKAMKFRRDKGRKISMIKAVIQATAVYQIQFDGSLRADGRAQVTSRIAGKLGLGAGVKSDDTIQGDGLIWGVRDDVSLAAVSQSAPPTTGAGEHPRALPTNKVAEVVFDAD
jgi:hypothetical protein